MMDVMFLVFAAALVVFLAVYALVRAAGRYDALAGGTACPRCGSRNVYQFARENGPPGWKCHPCGRERPDGPNTGG
jgi:transposase-like protein